MNGGNIKIRRERRNKNFKMIFVCIIFFSIGFYMLNDISKMEKPPLGNTFHIIMGCALMSISLLFFSITIKKQFFPKKRKRTKQIFLEDITKNKDS